MIPWLILAVVVVPILVVAFRSTRRRDAAGEHPVTETQVDRDRTEAEFEESERYQARWREETRGHQEDTLLP